MSGFEELAHQAAAAQAAGNSPLAEQTYRQMLALSPRHTTVLRDLAWLLANGDRSDEAVDLLRQAIDSNPRMASYHSELAALMRRVGQTEQAIDEYRIAVRMNPTDGEAFYNLGNALLSLRDFAAAAAAYQQTLSISPADIDANLNLGVARKELGQLAEAKTSFQRTLALKPDSAEALVNLGLVARTENNLDAAADYYHRALALQPNHALAHAHFGALLQAQGRLSAAVQSLHRAIECRPGYATAHSRLAAVYEELGQWRKSREHYAEALRLAPSDALRIRAALVLPIIAESQAEIDEARRQVRNDLAELEQQALRIDDPVNEVSVPLFYLAYQGKNECELQTRFAELLRRTTPSLSFTASHIGKTIPTHGRRIKIGFVSQNLRAHTIGKLSAGLIRELDRRRFEVTVFQFPGHDDSMSRFIADSANNVIVLPWPLAEARDAIAARELDVLYFPDVGMDPTTYFLAHARLAPVQCVTWGHPLTTGISTIDYFISSRDLEPADADAHYREKLVRLEHLTNYYYRPDAAPRERSRADYGIDPQAHWYTCPQTLFKLHPDNDALWTKILQADPLATIVLLEGKHAAWQELLRSRLAKSLGADVSRVRFVPRQTLVDFQQLLALSDVMLDPLHFGGGDTSYEGFAVGTPIVTLPGNFLRSRITYTMYRQMGLDELVAQNAEDYVTKAVRLATDRPYRDAVSGRIRVANQAIYENATSVRELEDFLEQTLQ